MFRVADRFQLIGGEMFDLPGGDSVGDGRRGDLAGRETERRVEELCYGPRFSPLGPQSKGDEFSFRTSLDMFLI